MPDAVAVGGVGAFLLWWCAFFESFSQLSFTRAIRSPFLLEDAPTNAATAPHRERDREESYLYAAIGDHLTFVTAIGLGIHHACASSRSLYLPTPCRFEAVHGSR